MDPLEIAIQEAFYAYEKGQIPIAAVLTIDGKTICFDNNTNNENEDWKSHAETKIIFHMSDRLRDAAKKRLQTTIYTTLEPCLMCVGAAALHRISKIVYACPDPIGGAARLIPPTEWYARRLPEMELRLDIRAYEIYMKYITEHHWKSSIRALERMKKELSRPTLFD